MQQGALELPRANLIRFHFFITLRESVEVVDKENRTLFHHTYS